MSRDLMRTPDEGLFEAIPVSDRVNKVANTGPELQERVEIVQPPNRPEKQMPGNAGSSRCSSDLPGVDGRAAPGLQAALAAFAGFFFGAQISAATIAAGPMAR